MNLSSITHVCRANRWLITVIAIVFFSSLLILSFFFRPINIDEAWLGEQSYWLSQTGIVKSRLFFDYLKWDHQLLVFHKLSIVAGSVFIKLFGWSIESLRLVSFSFFILMMAFVIKYYKKQWILISLFLLLAISNAFLGKYLFFFRPEIMLMSVGFIAFYYIDLFLRSNRQKHLFLGGIISGLCPLIHLNGLVFPAALGFLLLLHADFKSVLKFGIVSLPVALCYFLDVLLFDQWDTFIYQFNNDPAIIQHPQTITEYLLKIIRQDKKFFHNHEIAITSSLFLLSLWLLRGSYSDRQKVLLRFLVILFLSLTVLDRRNSYFYVAIFVPYMLIIICDAVNALAGHHHGFTKQVMMLGVAIYMACGLFFYGETIYNGEDDVEKNNEIAARMPKKGTKVLAPLDFIYDQMEQYHIGGWVYYYFYGLRNNGMALTPALLFEDLFAKQIQYVVFDDHVFSFSGIDKNDLIPEYRHYGRIYADDETIIYSLK